MRIFIRWIHSVLVEKNLKGLKNITSGCSFFRMFKTTKVMSVNSSLFKNNPYQSAFKKHSFIYENIPHTISLFYFCITVVSSWLYLPVLNLEEYSKLDPPNLLFFIKYLSPEYIIAFSNITPLILLITALFPKYQFLRIAAALFYTFTHGVFCSHGIDDHDQLTLVYGTIALAFMPNLINSKVMSRIDKHIRIFYFWIFHGVILMPYFVSGLTKVFYGGVYQLIFDDVSIWSPHAMAYVTEFYLWRIGSDSWLGDIIINNIWLSAPMYVLATVLEISALLPLFFPKLWKLIVLKLIIFHLLLNWSLNILFISNMLILLIVIYNTPFSYPLHSLKEYYISIKSFYRKH